ncbi:hypothetical protein AVEN_80904-1 [Araneus ventricosus]|uniref:Uncharacterized protein n=1 Tax=Araneus ventricosus TaxID=182803 RepID=A0A4Y2DLI2_ARAVE|nr:hypothetical protein AVEN_80904-1 [Araneus ventricosus]
MKELRPLRPSIGAQVNNSHHDSNTETEGGVLWPSPASVQLLPQEVRERSGSNSTPNYYYRKGERRHGPSWWSGGQVSPPRVVGSKDDTTNGPPCMLEHYLLNLISRVKRAPDVVVC